jgi:hypothetical protein
MNFYVGAEDKNENLSKISSWRDQYYAAIQMGPGWQTVSYQSCECTLHNIDVFT